MNEEKNSKISRNKEDFGVEDIEEYERLLEKDKGKSAEENIEHTINRALPNLLLDFIAISVISIPIVLVFWLGIKAPPLAIVVTVFFSCLTVYTFYNSLSQIIKWRKIKDIVLPELKSETAVHFHRISISVTDHYLITWSAKNVNVFELCDVKCLDGKKGKQSSYGNERYEDILLLKRNRKIPKIVGRIVDCTEVDKATKLIEERKN